VLATHWDDDHIRGLAEIVERCAGARFVCSAAFRTPELLELTRSNVLGAEKVTSGVRELRRTLEIVRGRRAAGQATAGPYFVLEDTGIERTDHCEVRALSPSSAAMERALAAIARKLPEARRPHTNSCAGQQ
jgi:hypothetical protein